MNILPLAAHSHYGDMDLWSELNIRLDCMYYAFPSLSLYFFLSQQAFNALKCTAYIYPSLEQNVQVGVGELKVNVSCSLSCFYHPLISRPFSHQSYRLSDAMNTMFLPSSIEFQRLYMDINTCTCNLSCLNIKAYCVRA